MTLALILVVSVIFAAICHVMAAKRGRRPALWGVLGFFFGPVPVLLLALMGSKQDRALPVR